MAVTLAQAAVTEFGDLLGDGSETTSFGSPVTAGNLIVVAISANDAGRTVTSVADDVGNNLAQAIFDSEAVGICAIWYKANVTGGGQVITTTLDGNSDGIDRIAIYEFAGIETAPTVVTSNAPSISVQSHPAGAITTPGTHAVVVGITTGTSGTYSADATFTQVGANNNNTTGYRIVTTSTSVNWTPTTTANETCNNMAAAFSGVADAAGGNQHRLLLGVG